MSVRSGWPVLALGLLVARVASAEPASDKVAAEALFDDARQLMKDGRYDLACPKLEASQRLDAGVGTLLHLADCYQRAGRLASAWATWREASAAARAAGQSDRERKAKEKADALEPLLPRLSIVVHATANGLTVTRDGQPVASTVWGSAVPVDPGTHEVAASAPGRRSWSKKVAIDKAQKLDLEIPELEEERTVGPVAIAAPEPSRAPTPVRIEEGPYWSRQRVLGAGLAGVGVILAGVGTWFGLRTSSTWSDVEAQCPNGRCAEASGKSLADDARVYGNVSTASFVAAGVFLAGGAVVLFTAKRTTIEIAPANGGIALGGSL